ncbi:hypothetical protein [Paenibacillus piri]|uniref:Methyltransferase n=1 Tax=Paenibacillus piri TaxID=2547395 RepID=A0A4R5KWL2_9BACL|nr:hypothetical protein [Paenibacillus piri]TDF99568.1 hypothetical protein E1757_06940 [Paenibacillus piri]
MSRKWERMVQKNTKTTNKLRAKQGKPSLSQAVSDGTITIKGRNWLMPVLLICVGIFCYITFAITPQDETLYWLTGGCYILLGVFTYFVRRPFLRIGKNFLLTRRFTGDKRADAAQIEEIVLTKDAVVIALQGKGGKWVFTRLYHRIDVSAMADKLKEFAQLNGVALKSE